MKIKSSIFFILLFWVFFIYQLKAQVVANFTATPTSGCPPLNVTFTNTSTGATSYSWNFGNGNTSTAPNPSALYSTSGTFTVTLTATNGGSSNIKTATITVFTRPIASFTTGTMPSCIGQVVTFTDNSTVGSAALTSWIWDFGDGTNQNTITGTVTHIYNTAGVNIPVSVLVTDANGCSGSTINPLTIAAAPVAAFAGNPTSACSAPLTVNFTNASTTSGAVTYLWNFGDGSPTDTATNPSHTYNAASLYTVTLTVTQGACSNQIVKTNFVAISSVVANFSADNTAVCAGQVVSFTNTSSPVTGTQSWDFGDGSPASTATNPTHAYVAAGTYTVSLIEGPAGCQNTVTRTSFITVAASPVAVFNANPTQSCTVPFNVTFINTSSAGIYNWNFGDGVTSGATNPTHVYAAPGAYTVTLTVTSGNGCVTVITNANYIVIPDPVVDFTATPRQGCIPLLVNFTSTSIANFDPIVSYIWTFGNGTATTTSPGTSNTYNSIGNFNVKLVVQTAAGCRDSVTKINYIQTGTQPTPGFSVVDPTVCFGTPAQFTDMSVGGDSAFYRFGLNAGTFSTPPGAPMPFSPVTNLFPDTGIFFVTQIVFNNGCADSLRINNIVTILLPKPIFTLQQNCGNPFSVNFTDASQGADSIVWNFGDGSPLLSDVANPTHVYATRGTKTVTLTAYNFTTNCNSPVLQTFTIAQPIAQFNGTPNIGCSPLTLTFSNTSQDEASNLWNFGDGNGNFTINFSPFTYTYFTPKLDTVKLVVTDVNGCKDSTTRIIIVYGPLSDFNANFTTGCTPFPVTFTDASVSDSALVLWTWDFGDLTPTQTVTTSTISHTYTTPGSYNVTMTVTDKNGCPHTATKTNYIKPTYPFPAFVADTFACRNEIVNFDASTTNVVSPATYVWNFGDGSANQTLSTPTTTHAYTTDNLYTVTLTVTDVNGCDSSIQRQIRIQHPTAAFTDSVPTIACLFTQMHFRDLSTGLGIVGWQWLFGDGAFATQQNPDHNYTIRGPYSVTLIVTNSAGCTDTIADSVFVPGPSGTFSFTPQAGCPPFTVTFTAVSATATSYTWDFGDGTVITNSPNAFIQHTYQDTTTATPILFLNSTLPDGTLCSLPAPPAGVVSVKIIIPRDSMVSNVTSGCYPLTVNFSDASVVLIGIPGDTINSWTWNFGDPGSGSNNTSTLKNPSHVYAQAGSYRVTLTVTTFGGCGSSNSLAPYIITAHPHPVAAFSVNSTSFNLPYDALICTNQSTGAITYIWNFGDGASSTLMNPTYLYSSVGTYPIQLIATSQFGCTDTAYKTVVTNSEVIFPNAFTPNGNGASGGSYTLFSTDNDVFFPYVYGVVDYQLEIFNRWGEQIFESLDIKTGWDGYYKGKLCDQGVYVWKAYLKLNNGTEFYKNGDVTLLR